MCQTPAKYHTDKHTLTAFVYTAFFLSLFSFINFFFNILKACGYLAPKWIGAILPIAFVYFVSHFDSFCNISKFSIIILLW